MSTSDSPLVSNVVSTPKVSHRGCAPAIRKMKLDYPELSERQIAQRVGCEPSNVHNVLRRFMGKNSERQLQAFQENKAEVYDAIQLRCLRSVTDDKLAKTPAISAITAAAILEDKARLVRGQATSLNVTALLDVADMLRTKQ